MHSTSYPSSQRVILVLSSHLSLGFHRCLFTSGFPKVFCMNFSFPLIATSPGHLIPFGLIVITVLSVKYRLWRSSLRNILRLPIPWRQMLICWNVTFMLQHPKRLIQRYLNCFPRKCAVPWRVWRVSWINFVSVGFYYEAKNVISYKYWNLFLFQSKSLLS